MIGKTIAEVAEGDHAEIVRTVRHDDIAGFIDAVGDRMRVVRFCARRGPGALRWHVRSWRKLTCASQHPTWTAITWREQKSPVKRNAAGATHAAQS